MFPIFILSMNKLREDLIESDELARKKKLEDDGPQASYGYVFEFFYFVFIIFKLHITNNYFSYGGKFGVQQDRMDRSAVGHDYIGKVEKHSSQTDHSTGFGGKFGVQTDRVDKVKL